MTGTTVYKPLTYTPFTQRRELSGDWNVFAVLTGLMPGVHVRGGVPYAEWLDDPSMVTSNGAEARDAACPAWWYNRVDESRQPRWSECGGMLGKAFFECPEFVVKEQCWERWDLDQPQQPASRVAHFVVTPDFDGFSHVTV